VLQYNASQLAISIPDAENAVCNRLKDWARYGCGPVTTEVHEYTGA